MKTMLTRNSLIKLTTLLTLIIASSANISSAQNDLANETVYNNEVIDLYSEAIFGNDIDFLLEPDLLFYGWKLEDEKNSAELQSNDFNTFSDCDSDTSSCNKVSEYFNSIKNLINSDLTIEEIESLFIL